MRIPVRVVEEITDLSVFHIQLHLLEVIYVGTHKNSQL